MQHPHARNEEFRRRVIAAALQHFRENGIGNSGLKQILTTASVKHGSFYYHFASKENLVHEALLHALEGSTRNWADAVGGRDSRFAAALRDYLCVERRDNRGEGCTVAALASEIGRLPVPIRQSVGEALEQIFNVLAAQFQDNGGKSKRAKAIAVYSMIIGALQLSRAVAAPQLSEEILGSALEVAVDLADKKFCATEK